METGPAAAIADILRTRYGAKAVGSGTHVLWQDGPSLNDVAEILCTAGYTSVERYWGTHIVGYLGTDELMATRQLSNRTLAVLMLREVAAGTRPEDLQGLLFDYSNDDRRDETLGAGELLMTWLHDTPLPAAGPEPSGHAQHAAVERIIRSLHRRGYEASGVHEAAEWILEIFTRLVQRGHFRVGDAAGG